MKLNSTERNDIVNEHNVVDIDLNNSLRYMQIFSVGHNEWKLVDPSEKRPMNPWPCKQMHNLHPGSLIAFSLRYF